MVQSRSIASKAPASLSQEEMFVKLRAAGFSDAIEEAPKRLIASIAGREKTGKTFLALTAPPPIIFFDIDLGTEGVVGKFQQQGKKIFLYHIRVPKGADQEVYKPLWQDFKQKVEMVYKIGRGTVVIDTASEAYELARLAAFGKLTQVLPHHYTLTNNEWREFMRLAYDSKMNTVYIHKMKPKYVNNARTSEYELSGFSEMNYMVQANLITYRENNPEGGIPRFTVAIQDCRANAALSGMLLAPPMPISFEFLINLVHAKPSSKKPAVEEEE